jgi:hypothetical protein
MWQYQIFLKDGSEKNFLIDEAYVPDEYINYCETHAQEIDCTFCDHYPQTVENWLGCENNNYKANGNGVWEQM